MIVKELIRMLKLYNPTAKIEISHETLWDEDEIKIVTFKNDPIVRLVPVKKNKEFQK